MAVKQNDQLLSDCAAKILRLYFVSLRMTGIILRITDEKRLLHCAAVSFRARRPLWGSRHGVSRDGGGHTKYTITAITVLVRPISAS